MSPKNDGNQVEVMLYRITGRQLFFNFAQSLCEECDLAVAAVSRAVGELKGIPIQFRVQPWLDRLPLALVKRAYHPPITLVDGKIVCQGFVPDVGQVKRAITEAAERRGIRMNAAGHKRVDAEAAYAKLGTFVDGGERQ